MESLKQHTGGGGGEGQTNPKSAQPTNQSTRQNLYQASDQTHPQNTPESRRIKRLRDMIYRYIYSRCMYIDLLYVYERPTKLVMQRFIYAWTSIHGMCTGAAEPIGAAPKTDTFKSEKLYAEPIEATPNDSCSFPPTSNFVRCSYDDIYTSKTIDSFSHPLYNPIHVTVLSQYPYRCALCLQHD